MDLGQNQGPTIISIGSGKGGVGKTLTTLHFAISSAKLGYRVLILDGDLGLSNIDVVLGLEAHGTIQDVLEKQSSFKDILLTGPLGIQIIPSGSGLANLAALSLTERLQIVDGLEELSDEYDVIIIDTGAGIHPNVLHLNSFSDHLLVVTTPEPHAMTDAYAFIKVMHEHYSIKEANLLVNKVVSQGQGLKVGEKIAEVSTRYLGLTLNLLGSVPKDDMIQRSVMTRGAVFEHSTHTIAGQAWNEIALGLLEQSCNRTLQRGKRKWMDLAFPSRQVSNTGSFI